MGETNESVLSLNDVCDLKKKMLFTLNIFKKQLRGVFFLSLFFNFFIYIGNKEFIIFCVCMINVIENETKIY